MRHMDEKIEKLCNVLDELFEGPLDMSSLDAIDKAAHAIKCLVTIEAMGYSWEGSHDEGGSYRRGRSMTTGRYISRASGRYSRDYSREDRMREKLEELMMDAPDENTRQELQRLIDKM